MNVYDQLRQIYASAFALHENIRANVTDPTLRDAWTAWFLQSLRPYYERYAGPNSTTLTRLAALFYAGDVQRHVDDFRTQLEDFHLSYERWRVR